ncbi:MAG: hypothetical protein LBU32_11900 [Clostridiales bacterium]|jgi:hypothetical protein|nr:hypothetical protein [Clostridiales bacterium]
MILRRKKIVLAAAAVALAALVGATGSLALMVSTTPAATNELAFVKLNADLSEGGHWDSNPEDVTELDKSIPVPKAPKVTNTNSAEAFVRLIVAGGIGSGKLIVEEYNTDNWFESPANSGVWYYKKILKPDETTQPLFTEVYLASNYRGDGHDLDINVYMEAVQAHILGYIDSVTPEDILAAFTFYESGIAIP